MAKRAKEGKSLARHTGSKRFGLELQEKGKIPPPLLPTAITQAGVEEVFL